MKKAEKNDLDFNELKHQYESVYLEQMNQIKTLIKERELLHFYIQRLERENTLLSSRTNQDQTIQLLTHASQTPHSLDVRHSSNLFTLVCFSVNFRKQEN